MECVMKVEQIRKNLESVGLLNEVSQIRTVRAIRATVEGSLDPLKSANSVVVQFGGKPEQEEKAALVKAQSLILQAQHAARTNVDLNENEAEKIAKQKVKDVMDAFPTVAKVTTSPVQSSGEPKVKRGGKREQAKEIYLANKSKHVKEIAITISELMNVSIANAYTYIYNVKKDLGEPTSSRGRKPN